MHVFLTVMICMFVISVKMNKKTQIFTVMTFLGRLKALLNRVLIYKIFLLFLLSHVFVFLPSSDASDFLGNTICFTSCNMLLPSMNHLGVWKKVSLNALLFQMGPLDAVKRFMLSVSNRKAVG